MLPVSMSVHVSFLTLRIMRLNEINSNTHTLLTFHFLLCPVDISERALVISYSTDTLLASATGAPGPTETTHHKKKWVCRMCLARAETT
jgi:hypothetical protein